MELDKASIPYKTHQYVFNSSYSRIFTDLKDLLLRSFAYIDIIVLIICFCSP